jgi:hypothetical protein
MAHFPFPIRPAIFSGLAVNEIFARVHRYLALDLNPALAASRLAFSSVRSW